MRFYGKFRIDRIRQRRAFTLIELLAVISVIALLMAILMPVPARVKESGRWCVCSTQP